MVPQLLPIVSPLVEIIFPCLSVCSTDLLSLSARMKKNCSYTATSEEHVVTSMPVVWMSSRILRRIFSMTMSSSLDKQLAAVLTEPAISGIIKLNCNTSSHAFHNDGGIALVWKNRVTDLLSGWTIFGFVVSHRMCAN